MRGLQWWNSGSWNLGVGTPRVLPSYPGGSLGSADEMVWTDVRTLRRLRARRGLKLALTVVLAAALGTVIVVAVANVHTRPPAALRQPVG